jgi:acetyl-CoA carboxylase biotin carboxyl carrier protein
MDYKNIINLIKEMNQTDLTKLEIEEEGFRICIERNAKEVPSTFCNSLPQTGTENRAPVIENKVSTSSVLTVTAEAQPENNYKKQVSPMVGTFYAQPAPDKPPFVKVGDKVKKGQIICIIEAMKLMNEIECEYDGEIAEILVQNEAMVEYGQPLFLIK